MQINEIQDRECVKEKEINVKMLVLRKNDKDVD